MTQGFSRRLILNGLLATAGLPGFGLAAWAGAPEQSLRPQPRGATPLRPRATAPARSIADLVNEAALGGHVSFVVADARTGLILETRDAQRALPPASVTKTITALYALNALGGDYRFTTKLVVTGPIVNGRVKGDLILVGGGDPVLNTDMLADMARDLKAAGVREVAGRFRVYGGALPYVRAIDGSQPDHLSYNPAVSGLNLNFNRVHFEWKRGAKGYDIVMDARARRYRPRVSVARMRVVRRQLPVYTYSSSKGVDNWTVASQALGKGGSRWLPVRRPDIYAAEVFQTLARAQGIVLKRAAVTRTAPTGPAVVVHQSTPLRAILKDLLKFSTNLTAEAVGLTATRARGRSVQSLATSAAAMTDWMDSSLGAKRSRFVDHSGLEEDNRATTGDLVAAVVKEGPASEFSRLLKHVPMRDKSGKKIKDHPIQVRAKTGTLNFVSALAGYVTTPDGSELAFAILTSDMKRRSAIARADREIPKGARSWNKRSKRLQQGLIERWAALYGG